jgi:hypothetical protein
VVWKLCGQETQAQSSRDVCVRVVTGRRRHEQRKQAQEQGKLGSFCMVPQPQLRAGLERIWIVIGRSVDRATRLSSPRAASSCVARCTFRSLLFTTPSLLCTFCEISNHLQPPPTLSISCLAVRHASNLGKTNQNTSALVNSSRIVRIMVKSKEFLKKPKLPKQQKKSKVCLSISAMACLQRCNDCLRS